MAEKITPNGTIERGFVDTGRLGRTGFDALADTLGVASEATKQGLLMARDRELKDIESKLSDATLTEAEIQEIEQSAKFPIAGMLARNRRGQLVAEQVLQDENISEALAGAADPIEAREILRKAKQRAYERAGGDAGVLAGINEHLGQVAGPLFQQAAKERRVRREQSARVERNSLLGSAVDQGGVYGAEVIVGMIEDQTLADPTNISELHSDAAQAFENRVNLDPTSFGQVEETIESILNTPGAISLKSDEAKYIGVLDKIEAYRKAAAAEFSTDKALKEAHAAAGSRINSILTLGAIPTEADIKAYADTATDPIAADKRARAMIAERTKNPVYASPAYKRQKAQLDLRMKSALDRTDEDDIPKIADAIDTFNTLAGSVDPSVLQDEQAAADAFSKLADMSIKDASSNVDRLAAQRVLIEDENTEISNRLLDAEEAGLTLGNEAQLRKTLERNVKALAGGDAGIQRRIRFRLAREAETNGINMNDDIVNLWE